MDTMDTPASTSTSATNVQGQEAQNGILAVDADGPSATIHIHIDLDSDAGMRQARDALSAVFGPVVAAAPQATASAAQPAAPAQVFAAPPAAPAQVFAAPPAAPAQVFAPAAQAAFQVPQSSSNYASPAAPDITSTLQQLLQHNTPGRRRGPGRPSRAETELRQLMQAAVAGTSGGATLSQAQAPHRNPCKICNQPKADCVLRNCGHQVCRACVVPYLQFRAVCPILNCGQPATLTDIIPLTI